MAKKIDKTNFREVKASALRFSERDPKLTLQAAEGQTPDTAPQRFAMRLYSGGKYECCLGDFVVDLTTISYKPTFPAMIEHETREIFGVVDNVTVANDLMVAGKIRKRGTAAQEVTDLLADQVPLEASARWCDPQTIMFVPEGVTLTVNGQDQEGPFELWQGCTLKEASVCAFGLDDETETLAAKDDGKTVLIPKPTQYQPKEIPAVAEQEKTIEAKAEAKTDPVVEVKAVEVKAEAAPAVEVKATAEPEVTITMTANCVLEKYPDAVKEILAVNDAKVRVEATEAAVALERQRFADLKAVYPLDFAAEMFAAGKTMIEAKAVYGERAAEENQKLKERVEELKRIPNWVACDSQFGKPRDWDSAVEYERIAGKLTAAQAVDLCAKKYPAFHKAKFGPK